MLTVLPVTHRRRKDVAASCHSVVNRVPHQIMPVPATASCWGREICSMGRWKSLIFANVMAHLNVGAQK